MTEEQKEILIGKMIDAPFSLSDGELDLILHDDELRDIYEVSAALSSACIRQPELDMKAEWKRFRPCIRRKPTAMRWGMQVAAIFLGVIIASSIVVRIIDNSFNNDQPSIIAKADQLQELKNDPVASPNPQATETKKDAKKEPAIKISHSTTLAHNLTTAEINNPPTTATQVKIDIDIEEYLRIQQARIDNDLAMQVAESYIEEYDDLVAILDATGADYPALDNVIRNVTME